MEKKNKIKKETTLKDIVEIEGAKEVLVKHKVPCLSCPMANFEIEQLEIGKVAEIYGLDLKQILEDLNSLI
jgi:hypothetical protein